MKRMVLSAVVLFFSTGVWAQSTRKVACIALEELLFSMPDAKKADTLLQDFYKELDATYVEMAKEYQQKDSVFKADSVKWNPTMRELKKGDLSRLVQQLQTWQQTAEQQLQKKRQELLVPIRAKAVDAIQKVAVKEGYAQVLEKSVVYFYAPEDDILDKVKKELHRGSAAKRAMAPKSTKK